MMDHSEKRICPICGFETKGTVGKNSLKNHLIGVHKDNKIDLLIHMRLVNKSLDWARDIPEDVLREFLKRIEAKNGFSRFFASQFKSSYSHISYVRAFDPKADMDLFFDKILPWKLDHPFQVNNKELAKLESAGNEEQEQKIYQHFMLEKNPYYKHDGSMSPWSKDFIGYKEMSEEEKESAVRKSTKADTREYSVRLSYYLNKGYSKEEAKEKQKKRQQTFSLEKCIAKYGEEKGHAVWKKRQEKWQSTLKSKPLEEIIDINRRKMSSGIGNHAESKFLMSVLPDEKYHNVYIKPAKAIGDLVYGNKIIEFYGDYWHCNPTVYKPDYFQKTIEMYAKDRWEADRKRAERLESLGYIIKIVWEKDYNTNKKQVIQECKEFLGVD